MVEPIDPSGHPDIPVGLTGTIRMGQYAGWGVRVEKAVGGYLILYERRDERGQVVEGYDDWVLSEDLARYFIEADLKVDWPEMSPPRTTRRRGGKK